MDDAFRWWRPLIAGGDVVVLRASGADGYIDYLYSEIGGCDSVETLLVTTRALAADPYVGARIAEAEGIFLAGGDQSTYLDTWRATEVEAELRRAWSRGAVVGGTSAGAAVLGGLIFGAHRGTITSAEALADPFDPRIEIDDALLSLPPMIGLLPDTHFFQRDRLGRLVTFLARTIADGRAAHALGVGLDEETALVVDRAGSGTVLGAGAVYVIRAERAPETITRGSPLTYLDVAYSTLRQGDTIELPAGTTRVATRALSVTAGVITPRNPY